MKYTMFSSLGEKEVCLHLKIKLQGKMDVS